MDEIVKTVKLDIISNLDVILKYLQLYNAIIDIDSIPYGYYYLKVKCFNCISDLYPNQLIENYQSPTVLTLDFDKESIKEIFTDDITNELNPELKNLRLFVKEYIGKLTMNSMKPIEPIEPIEPIYECSICLEGLINKEDSCETPCCFKTFHKENCIGLWLKEHKKCPMCRARIRSKLLLFPIKLRTSTELKEDIAIAKYRSLREPNRKEVLKNIKERNEDTVYIDEIEDDDNDGMPDLINLRDPLYYDSPLRYVSPLHYIGASAVPYLGLQLPAANADYDDAVDNDGLPELVPYYNGWNETPNHYIGINTPSIGQTVPYAGDFDGDEFNPYIMPPPLSNLEPMYYDDGLDSLLVPNVIPNIELATFEDLIITPEINIMEEVD